MGGALGLEGHRFKEKPIGLKVFKSCLPFERFRSYNFTGISE